MWKMMSTKCYKMRVKYDFGKSGIREEYGRVGVLLYEK